HQGVLFLDQLSSHGRFRIVRIELPRLQQRFHVSQGNRQGCIAVQLDDAEGGGEFGNGGKRINSHLEGKLVTVGKATPRIVREPFGKLDGQGFFLREGAIELYVVNRAHGDFCFAPLVVFTGQFRPVDFFAGFQDDFFCQLRRYRRGEVEPHGEERNTGGVGIGTVAVEGDGELVAHRVGEDLLLSGGDPGGGGDAGSPDQLHLRLGRETLAAADGECPVVIGTSR